MYSLDEAGDNKQEIIEYTAKALKETGHSEIIENMKKRATYSEDHDTLIMYCQGYLDIANGLVK